MTSPDNVTVYPIANRDLTLHQKDKLLLFIAMRDELVIRIRDADAEMPEHEHYEGILFGAESMAETVCNLAKLDFAKLQEEAVTLARAR